MMYKKIIYLICLLLLVSLTVNNASAELIGWWKFDGDFIDSSGNDNIATPVGNPSFVEGMLDQAINLNPVNTEDYINCGSNMGFATIGDGGEADGFSIAAWVNRTVAGDDHKICSNLSVSSWAEGAGFQFAIFRNRTELDMRDSTGRFFSRDVDARGFTELEINRWYHIVFVFDDIANTLTEYIDGEKTHTLENIPTSLAASPVDFMIGSQSPTFNASRVFRGMIDDFRLYSNAVTEEEVETIMQGGFVAFPQAADPIPEDETVVRETSVTLSWSPGDFAITHNVYFGDNLDDVDNGTDDTFKGNQSEATYTVDNLVPGTTYYWRIDEVNPDKTDSPWKGEIWSLMVAPTTAFDPNVTDGAYFVDVNNPVLSWEPGFGAQTHTVYFGDDPDVVANATGGTEQTEVSFNPGQLEYEKFYYWRVDEFDGTETYTGAVWGFKTAKDGGGIRGSYYNDSEFRNLVLTRIDPQINFRWDTDELPDESITSGLYSIRWTGLIEAAFTETYTFYTTTLGGVRLWVDDQLIIDHWPWHAAFLDAGSIDLEAGNSYSIAMDFYHTDRDSIAELRWESPRTPTEFVPQAAFSLPVKALKPTPGNGAVGVAHTPTITWAPGEIAASHELYFGTDREAVRNADKNSAEYVGPRALGEESYEPGKLEWFTTYYWRVDEINNDGSTETGSVWNFTTADFLMVDDFESYNDIEAGQEGSNLVYMTWIDGYVEPPAVPTNGSTMGYVVAFQPSMEYDIVHSGNQSAPFLYDNTSANYSEVTVNTNNLTIGKDWTREDVKVLTLWFYGDPNNSTTEQLYIKLNNVKIVYDGSPDDIATPQWTQWNIELSEFGIGLTNVTSLGIGLDKTGATGGSGTLFLDDVRLYRVAP